MAPLSPANPQYICRTCLLTLSLRPTLPSRIPILQSSTYATTKTKHLKSKQDANPSRAIDTSRLRARLTAEGSTGPSPPRLDAPLRRTKRRIQPPPPRSKSLRNNKVAGVYRRVFPWEVAKPRRVADGFVRDLLQQQSKEPPIRKQYMATPTPEELEPSAPTTRVFKKEKPATHHKLHFGNLEGFNWYWETIAPSIAHKLSASTFFTQDSKAQFLRSAARFRNIPESDVPEVAFVGRSNVGKSSLLNAIVNADTKELLARTSKTPGFTKTMNLYGIGGADGIRIRQGKSGGHDKIVGMRGLVIVDMPGYGEGSLATWGLEIMKYIQGRKQLRRVFVLIDAQHGIKDKDRSLLASLRLAGVSHQVILSKLDRVYLPTANSLTHSFTHRDLSPRGSLADLGVKMKEIKEEIQPQRGGSALGELLACSSEALVDGRLLGIDSIRFAMLQAAGHRFGFEEKIRRTRYVKTDIEDNVLRMKKAVVRGVHSEVPKEEGVLGLESL